MKSVNKEIVITNLLMIFMIVIFSASIFAKRSMPPDILPVRHKGIEYRTVKWAHENGTGQNGGYIEARRISDGKRIWGRLVYTTGYIPGLERDVQDVFIKKMSLSKSGDYLIVINEKNERYHVSLNNGKSRKQ